MARQRITISSAAVGGVSDEPTRYLARERFAELEEVADLLQRPVGFQMGHVRELVEERKRTLSARRSDLLLHKGRIEGDLRRLEADLVHAAEQASARQSAVVTLRQQIEFLSRWREQERGCQVIESYLGQHGLVLGENQALPLRGFHRWVRGVADESALPHESLLTAATDAAWSAVMRFVLPRSSLADGTRVQQLQRRIEADRARLVSEERNGAETQQHEARVRVEITNQQNAGHSVALELRELSTHLDEMLRQPPRTALRWLGDGNLITFAPPGAGKGAGLVIPNLLSYPGSVVVLDVKGTNYAVTARARRAMGQRVVLLDPFGVVRRLGLPDPCASLNPLDMLDPNDPNVTDDALALASSMVLRSSKEVETFAANAEVILQGLILYILSDLPLTQRNFGSLRQQLAKPASDWSNLLKRMQTSKKAHGVIAECAVQFGRLSKDHAASSLAKAMESTKFLESPQVKKTLASTRVNQEATDEAGRYEPRDLKSDAGLAIYLVIPEDKGRPYAPLSRLFITTFMKIMQHVPRRPRHRALFLLDEADQLCRMDLLRSAVGIMRERGMTFWLIYQNLHQLKSWYPNEEWRVFLSNSAVQQFFAVQDLETAEYISEQLGKTTHQVLSESANQSLGEGISATRTATRSNTRTVGATTAAAQSWNSGEGSGYSGPNAVTSQSTGRGGSSQTGTSEADAQGTSDAEANGTTRSQTRGTGESVTPTETLLLSPAQIRRLQPSRMIVFCENRRAMLLDRVSYLEDAELAGKFDPNPLFNANGR